MSSSAAAGAFAGALVAGFGRVISVEARVGIGTLAAIVVGAICHQRWVRLPQVNRETKQALLESGPLKWAALNGSLLGLGFTSRIGFWIWYAIPLGCFVLGSPLLGAIVWGSYGAARMGAAFLLALAMRRNPASMAKIADAFLGKRVLARHVSNIVLSCLMVAITLRLGL